MNIYEVLDYGPIMAQNEELGILITVNGSYFNIWVDRGNSKFENVDCVSLGNGMDGLYGIKTTDLIKKAEEILDEVIKSGNEE